MSTKITSLPDADRVMRYVPWTKLRKDEDDNVLGFNPQAFQLRTDEKSPTGWEEALSVNWVEHFRKPETQIRDCVWAIRKTRGVGAKSAFAVGNVGQIKETCLAHSVKVRILHESTDDDPSHAAIRRLPPDDLTLLAALAEDAFTDMIRNVDIPAQPGSV